MTEATVHPPHRIVDDPGLDGAPPPGAESSDGFIAASRERLAMPLEGRDRLTSVALGGAFLATAVAMAILFPWERPASLLLAAFLIVAYAITSRVEFEVGTGSAVPTQVLFVPMLFALPVAVVPLCVAVAYLLGALTDYITRRVHVERTLVLLSSCWFSVGPTLVFAAAEIREPDPSEWPVYLAALAAQFAFDLASSTTRECFAFGNSARSLLPFFSWVYAVDVLLAPAGLLAAFASAQFGPAFLLTLPLVALLALLARDRQARIDRALELSRAYIGASTAARSDPLTGLKNRLAWEEAVSPAASSEQAPRKPVSVIVLDVNNLKAANDTRGHVFGDMVLRRVAEAVRSSVRDQDLVARIGGDEFGVLMRGSTEEACTRVARRMVEAIAALPPLDGFKLSAALGYSSCPPAAGLSEAIREADARMYAYKSQVLHASGARTQS